MSPQITSVKAQFGTTYNTGWDGFTVTHADAIACGIRWFEVGWDKFQSDLVVPTHAFKILGPDLTVEAFTSGVGYGSLSAYIKDPNKMVFVRCPIMWTDAMGQACIDNAPTEIGKAYNFGLIAAMAGSNSRLGSLINVILGKRRFTDWIDKNADSQTKAICSQSTARLDNLLPELHNKGCLALDPDQEEVTPMMLFTDDEIYTSGANELIP